MNETTYAEAREAAGPPPERETLNDIYEQAHAEGHLITSDCLTPDEPEEESWIIYCSCGASSLYTGPNGEPEDGADVRLMTYNEARWWARGHRTEQGLEWQQWIPNTPGRFLGTVYFSEGHCVAAINAPGVSADPHAAWFAFCSCGQHEDGPEVELGVNCQKAATEEGIKLWADEHRKAHDLEPQAVLPHPSLVYSGVERGAA